MSDSEDLRILAEELVDFVNGVEASCVKLRTQIDKLFGSKEEKPQWDSSKIKWTEAEGSSGPYQRSEDVNSSDFKEAMKDLEAHNGKLSRKEADGTYFYWKFQKSPVIGRKRK